MVARLFQISLPKHRQPEAHPWATMLSCILRGVLVVHRIEVSCNPRILNCDPTHGRHDADFALPRAPHVMPHSYLCRLCASLVGKERSQFLFMVIVGHH